MSALPRGWADVVVSDVLESWDRLREPLNADERASRTGPYAYYGANGQVGTIDDFRFDGSFVLVAEDGGYFDQPQRGVAYEATGKFWVNNHAHVLKPRGEMSCRFFRHALNALDWMPHVGGSTRLKLTAGSLERVPLRLPPLDEQRRIVEKLDAIFERSRAAKARLERLPALLDQLKRSILAAAFRGDLTKDWRAKNPDVEPASVLLERIRVERRRKWEEALRAKGKDPKKATYEEPAPVDTSELPELPAGWAWASLEALAAYSPYALKAGPFGSALKKEDYSPTGAFKVYGQEQVINGDARLGDYFIDEQKFVELRSCEVQPGDVLVSLVGTVGRVLVLPEDAQAGIINPRLVKISLAPSGMLPVTLQRFLQSPFARSWMARDAHGGTMEILNLGILRSLPIPVPPLEEQHAMLSLVDGASSLVEATKQRLSHSLGATLRLEQAALAKAFRGELVPQAPADEPADVLLERLRAARASEPAARRTRAARATPAPAAPATTTTAPADGDPVERIIAVLRSNRRQSASAIADATGLAAAEVRGVLKSLERLGKVAVEGKARGTTYVWQGDG